MTLLRIGILGAEAFAAERGIPRVHDGYAKVLADPDVDLVYNALVNSLHTPWNLKALHAGKHVLSEKPLASNAIEAALVRETARTTGRPVHSGGSNASRSCSQSRVRPTTTHGGRSSCRVAPPWISVATCCTRPGRSAAGGWASHASPPPKRRSGRRGWTPAWAVELRYPNDTVADCRWDMAAADRTMTWTVVGTRATATAPAFAVPHLDPRLLLTREGRATAENLGGNQTSYAYQLAAVTETLPGAAPFLVDLDDAVANAELVDQCYRSAGPSPRGR